jgi:hypothetical protein
MAAEREQEQSIKDRKRLLYDADDPIASSAPTGDRKPFALHLRETPAARLPTPIKAALWGAGVLVTLLLAAAVYKATQHKAPPSKAAPATPRAR